MMTEQLSARALAKHYINICNTALAQRSDEVPYKQIIDLIDNLYSGETITLKIENNEGEVEQYVTTRFIDERFTPIQEGIHDPDTRVTLKREYLEDVVENSDDYIRHPRKLDWSWLVGQNI